MNIKTELIPPQWYKDWPRIRVTITDNDGGVVSDDIDLEEMSDLIWIYFQDKIDDMIESRLGNP